MLTVESPEVLGEITRGTFKTTAALVPGAYKRALFPKERHNPGKKLWGLESREGALNWMHVA